MDISLLDQTLITQIVTCFVAGFLSALTPCVYPLIPVTIALFTSCCKETRYHQFLRSACFAFGICVVYTILGLLAANAGIFFGSYLGGSWFVAIVTLLLVTMILSTLGILHVPFFSSLQCLGNKISGQGCFGAFLLGAGSGLIAAPCVGPILATILVIAASHQNPTLGGLLLFLYSLGLSIPFLLLGTFSGLLSRIPRSGNWLHWVKFITAIGIVMTISFFHRGHLDSWLTPLSFWRLPLALGGIFAFGIIFGKIAIQLQRPFVKLFGVLLCSFVIYHLTLFTPVADTSDDGIAWHKTLKAGLEAKHSDIIFVDSFATWCGTCKELEEKTFHNAAVQNALSSFTNVKVDFSDYDSEANNLSKKYNIQGIPTMLFLNQKGEEIHGSRLLGFIGPSEFLSHLSMVEASIKSLEH